MAISEKDNSDVEALIRYCLAEFGADHEGTAWEDPDLGRFSEIYNTDGNRYWVAKDPAGRVLGGVGIGHMTDDICELQKMYCMPEIRGTGVAHKLINIALEYAAKYYDLCYLETFSTMIAAQKFYEKYGFSRTTERVVDTGHYACDVLYIKSLRNEK